ncbi:tRNA pseudouridine(55) synthase TruB [Virgibacillus sp. MSP4-1]|uniref:tRNA pseudouridine(55) synthase TruB n=1 Tax=Virgibacillus sp. MSP4-1 TaxID=2700081 RepID=UPI00039A1B9C|nr:tRNA pseudouridine(55) synthase TruB [Virgibacillus sp. MSP4-1]QHS22292.1 tRNA pseudouridine(55) synthase TruB [Virgibacillus sp. MSP4-1]
MEGILPLWKEPGLTSHDCVFKVRKLLKIKKVGHTGTLDPQVDGILPICIGQATKISSIIMESPKVYEAEITLGIATETEDQEGQAIKKEKVSETLTIDDIERALSDFEGEIEQTPPMYSAVKVKGKKLYEYARMGIEVERPQRSVTIHHMELLSESIDWSEDYSTASFRIRVKCSKGTYIRTLCVDIGSALGYPAHMSQLTRTESGTFCQTQSITLEDLRKAVVDDKIEENLYSIDFALQKFDTLYISEQDVSRYKHGQVLPLPGNMPSTDPFRIKVETTNELIALYQIHPSKKDFMKPHKMFQVPAQT